jgi:hypothetical protein
MQPVRDIPVSLGQEFRQQFSQFSERISCEEGRISDEILVRYSPIPVTVF